MISSNSLSITLINHTNDTIHMFEHLSSTMSNHCHEPLYAIKKDLYVNNFRSPLLLPTLMKTVQVLPSTDASWSPHPTIFPGHLKNPIIAFLVSLHQHRVPTKNICLRTHEKVAYHGLSNNHQPWLGWQWVKTFVTGWRFCFTQLHTCNAGVIISNKMQSSIRIHERYRSSHD